MCLTHRVGLGGHEGHEARQALHEALVDGVEQAHVRAEQGTEVNLGVGLEEGVRLRAVAGAQAVVRRDGLRSASSAAQRRAGSRAGQAAGQGRGPGQGGQGQDGGRHARAFTRRQPPS